jgi:hypothetical protein
VARQLIRAACAARRAAAACAQEANEELRAKLAVAEARLEQARRAQAQIQRHGGGE